MVREIIQNAIYKNVVKMLVNYASNASSERLVQMARLAEKIAKEEETRRKIQQLKRQFENGHPAVELGKKIITTLSPACKKKLIENFFVNAGIVGNTTRQKIYEKDGYRPPFFLLISPTMRCNLNCIGCSTREFDKKTDMPFEMLDNLMNQAKRMGMYFVTTLGGEMFVYDDIWKLWEKHNDCYFQVYTNGTLIDEKAAHRLSELGNVAPMISVEGYKEETDWRRGKGVWDKIMAAMDRLSKEGVLYGASVTQTSRNSDIVTSEEFVDFLISKGCRALWYFQYIPIGKNPDLSLMPNPEQRDKLRKMVLELRPKKPIFFGDFWNDGPYVKGCIAGGRSYLHVNNRGDIEPCGFVHFATDNINRTPLAEALQSPFFREIRKRQQAYTALEPYAPHACDYMYPNMLTPCMIIDQPWVLREAVKKTGAYATQDGDEELLGGDRAKFLDEYSKRMHEIYDAVWATDEYKKHKDSLCRRREKFLEEQKVEIA